LQVVPVIVTVAGRVGTSSKVQASRIVKPVFTTSRTRADVSYS
jgi:hypothetical protein